MVTEHKDYLSSLPGVAMWLLTHKLMLCAHLPGHSPGGSRLGSFSCYLEQSQVDKRNTWRLAGDQAEELDDAHEHLSVLAELEGGGGSQFTSCSHARLSLAARHSHAQPSRMCTSSLRPLQLVEMQV